MGREDESIVDAMKILSEIKAGGKSHSDFKQIESFDAINQDAEAKSFVVRFYTGLKKIYQDTKKEGIDFSDIDKQVKDLEVRLTADVMGLRARFSSITANKDMYLFTNWCNSSVGGLKLLKGLDSASALKEEIEFIFNDSLGVSIE